MYINVTGEEEKGEFCGPMWRYVALCGVVWPYVALCKCIPVYRHILRWGKYDGIEVMSCARRYAKDKTGRGHKLLCRFKTFEGIRILLTCDLLIISFTKE